MVSVIIPVYNGERYLAECLRSVIGQSCSDIEIIVVDDGSTDGSYSICKSFAEKDPRIRPFRRDNSGVSATRNFAISQACGDYITFLDADDEMTPCAIEIMLNAASEETDFVIGSYEVFRGKSAAKKLNRSEQFDFSEREKYELVFQDIVKPPWAKLYRASILQENGIRFPEDIPYAEDHIFNLEYIKLVQRAKVIQDVVYRYRQGGIATSVKYHSDTNKYKMGVIQAYERLFDGIENIPNKYFSCLVCDCLKGCLWHYTTCCSYRKSCDKIKETVDMLECYINENTLDSQVISIRLKKSVLRKNAKKIYSAYFYMNGFHIIKRKIKRLLVFLIKKRI